MSQSQPEHVAALAQELLDDIELGRVEPAALLLKASRLARFVGTTEIREWLALELGGYNDSTPVAKYYMKRTRRWVDQQKRTAYWGGFAEQVATVESLKAEQQTVRVPNVEGQYALLTVRDVMNRAGALGNQIRSVERVITSVTALLHEWVSGVNYELMFGGAAADIFEQFRSTVDARLSVVCADVLERLPSVYDRLQSDDPEAVSQAMTTCRRIIDAFADSAFPVRDKPQVVDDHEVQLGAQHHQNRLNAFVADHTESKTRRKRLRQTLANLYDRVCAAIHDDLSRDEARALVLQTYVYLGELAVMEVTAPSSASSK